eukprot:7996715-Pyramimonas_sp.AAC.1
MACPRAVAPCGPFRARAATTSHARIPARCTGRRGRQPRSTTRTRRPRRRRRTTTSGRLTERGGRG